MAFSLQAILGSTTVSLTDKNPFGLLNARGMGGADVRRVTTQGPAQDGDTDKGYRLQPREIELTLVFSATTDALLDGYRDTLMGVFKPLTATPVYLRATRDDGEVRQLDCYVVGEVKIDLTPELRPAHTHRATVRLRAADPAWYRATAGTVTLQGSTLFSASWWLAGGAIDPSQVLMNGGTPSANEAWSYTGTVVHNWTLAVLAEYLTANGTASWMFSSTANPGADFQPTFGRVGTATYGTPYYGLGNTSGTTPLGTTAMTSGTQVYFLQSATQTNFNRAAVMLYNKTFWIKPDDDYFYLDRLTSIAGTTMRWRTSGWTGAVPLYALYTPALSENQRSALRVYMQGGSATAAQAAAVSYEGDLPEYPVISLTGPIVGPSITNQATGETLDFGTITIGAGTTYVIDTRPGYKTVYQGTINKRSELTAASDLGTWHLAPDPVADGGVNVIAVSGTGTGTATTLRIVYYNRYQSY